MIGRQGKSNSIGYNAKTKQIFVKLAAVKNPVEKSIMNTSRRNFTSMSPGRGSLNFVQRKNELKKQIDENIRMLKKINYVKPTV